MYADERMCVLAVEKMLERVNTIDDIIDDMAYKLIQANADGHTKTYWKFKVKFLVPYNADQLDAHPIRFLAQATRNVWIHKGRSSGLHLVLFTAPEDGFKGFADSKPKTGHALYCFDEDLRCAADRVQQYERLNFYL